MSDSSFKSPTADGERSPEPAFAASRRGFLAGAGAFGANFLLLNAFGRLPALATEGASKPGVVVDSQPWGQIIALHEGVWAVVSTPLAHKDWTTVCNGGIIAGADRVLVVESFVGPTGATWVADKARELTGRRPTDIVITHYHGDHANGIEGFEADGERPVIWTTATTRALIRDEDAEREIEKPELRREMLEGAEPLAEKGETKMDLGGLEVTIYPRLGHTASDLTVELDAPSIVFAGDLVWKSLYPNYRDTLPSSFAAGIRALRRDRETTYVSGHGPVATDADLERLLRAVDDIGEVARQAHSKGMSPADAAATYSIPVAAGEWTLFRDTYFQIAIEAWYRELDRA